MNEQIRTVPAHRWLFTIAIVLTVLAIPHAVVVYVQHLPGAIVTLHVCATVGLWLFAELRRQGWERAQVQGDLVELVAAAERR